MIGWREYNVSGSILEAELTLVESRTTGKFQLLGQERN